MEKIRVEWESYVGGYLGQEYHPLEVEEKIRELMRDPAVKRFEVFLGKQ